MRRQELIVGQRYILDARPKITATYEGLHEGILTLADGSQYRGEANYLRFRWTDAEGVDHITLLDTGAKVDEAEATKILREQAEADRKERQQKAYEEASAFMAGLGFALTEEYRPGPNELRVRYRNAETADDVELDGVTVGKIKAMVSR